jgi:hypothetical protein
VKHETYRQLFGDYDNLTDDDFSPQSTDLVARREGSFEALKVYSGSFTPPCTSTERFFTTSPKQDGHPWPTRNEAKEAGVSSGSLEDVDITDIQDWALEMLGANREPEETQAAETGRRRPSSDTYSLAQWRETYPATTKERDRQHRRSRNWRSIRMRKRKTGDGQPVTPVNGES